MNGQTSRQLLLSLALIVTLVLPGLVRADTRVTIDELNPADAAHLAPGASLYVRMSYQTDEPVRLWARPYANGSEVKQTLSNASSQYSGAGQALGWFALREPGSVDEIRVIAAGGSPYREWLVTSLPVQLQWNAAGVPTASAPAWVSELQQQDAAKNAELARQRASEPGSAGDTLFAIGFMLLVGVLLAGGIALPLRGALRWHGGWRIAAFAPVALMAFVILRIVADTARDPTFHNLWPFEILTYGAAALIFIAVLAIARRILGVRA